MKVTWASIPPPAVKDLTAKLKLVSISSAPNNNTSPNFDHCFPGITMKTELRIGYQIKMFMLCFNNNFRLTENTGGWSTAPVSENNLYSLFVFFRIKLHLPLVY